MDLVASDIVNLSEVETRHYQTGERLGGDATERLRRLHVYIRDGAIGLRVIRRRDMKAELHPCPPNDLPLVSRCVEHFGGHQGSLRRGSLRESGAHLGAQRSEHPNGSFAETGPAPQSVCPEFPADLRVRERLDRIQP